jgi:uncharacterized protein with beta-barrel porin domain
LGGALIAAAPAVADCTLDAPSSTVTCTDTATGYGDGTDSGLTVDIQAGTVVTVSNASEGFKLLDSNLVDNLGTINVTGANSFGIDFFSLGTDNIVNNGQLGDATPTINVIGDGAVGIRDAGTDLGVNRGLEVNNYGQIEVTGADATGIEAGENAFIDNEFGATINITGAGHIGILAGDRNPAWVDLPPAPVPTVRNMGTISMDVDGSIGIQVGAGMVVENAVTGIITVDGANSIGIQSGFSAPTYNNGTMNVDGTSAVGMSVGDWNETEPPSHQFQKVFNGASGRLNVNGDGAVGIRIGNGWGSPDAFFFPVENSGRLIVSGTGATGFLVGDGAEFFNGGGTPKDTSVWGDGAVGFELGKNSLFDSEHRIFVTGNGASALRIGANDGSIPDFVTVTNQNRIDGGSFDDASTSGPLIVFVQPTDAMPGVNRLRNVTSDETLPRIFSQLLARPGGVAIQGTDPVDDGTGQLVGGVEEIYNELNAYIHGAIDLRGGNDLVENLGGWLSADILLGGGDDTFQIDPLARLSLSVVLDPGPPEEVATYYANIVGGGGDDTVNLLAGSNRDGVLDLDQFSQMEHINIFDGGTWSLRNASDGDLEEVRVLAGGVLQWTNATDEDTGLPAPAPDIQGDLIFDPDANLQILLDPANSDSPATPNEFLNSPIAANGQAILDGAAQLLLTEGSENLLFELLSQGSIEVRVIDAATLIGRFGDIAPPASIYSVDAIYDETAGTMDLALAFTSFTGAATTPNQEAVAEHLDDVIRDVNSGALAELMAELLGLDDASLAAAYDQLHPEAYDAQASAMLSLGNRFTRAVLERPRLCITGRGESRRDAVTGQVCRERRWEPWAEGFGLTRTLTGDEGHISHSDTGGGGMFGVDHRIRPSLRITGTVGGATTSIDVIDVGLSKLDTLDAGVSASWRRNALRVQGALTYSHGWHEVRRTIDVGDFHRTTETRYGTDRIGLRAETDYAFRLGGWNLAPLASLDYTALLRGAVQEIGAGQAGLLIDESSDSIVTIRAGFQLAPSLRKDRYWTEFLEFLDGIWRPRLGVAWRQVVAGNDRALSSRFIGADPAVTNFVVEGRDANQGFEVGFGLEFTPARADRITLGFFYDGFLWTNVQAHELGMNVQFAF